MKIFGRNLNPRSIGKKVVVNAGMIPASLRFRAPLSLWRSYLFMKSPASRLFEFRNGYKVSMSSNPHDGITIMVIFCRNEYGRIPRDGVVIDIGANIGAFSLYAAMNGAKKVYAFEPNVEAFEVLKANIELNSLQHVIVPFNLAVAARDNESIMIPHQASPYNRAMGDGFSANANYDLVSTISLESILKLANVPRIALCKIDCEGAEYDILYSTPGDVLNSIDHVRLEHHDSARKGELVSFFERNSFRKIHDKNIMMWFESDRKRD